MEQLREIAVNSSRNLSKHKAHNVKTNKTADDRGEKSATIRRALT
jgi:hypothetical protein